MRRIPRPCAGDVGAIFSSSIPIDSGDAILIYVAVVCPSRLGLQSQCFPFCDRLPPVLHRDGIRKGPVVTAHSSLEVENR